MADDLHAAPVTPTPDRNAILTPSPAPEAAKPSIFSGAGTKPAEKAPDTAATRLRAFEDKHLGKNAVRISGTVEKGHGSAFALKMIETPELRREYAALERLHETEQALAVAEGALSAAQSVHATALAAADDAAKAADVKPEPGKAA